MVGSEGWKGREGRSNGGGPSGEVGIPLVHALRGGLRWPSVESMVELATRAEGERRG